MNFDVSWTQIITIAVTQTISTVTTFYILKALNVIHSNEIVKKKRKKNDSKVLTNK